MINRNAIVFLKPGELAVTRTPKIFETILGSCVAVCLWDRQSACGGMNHFMLSRSREGKGACKYGDYATQTLISKIKSMADAGASIVAKIFGGANVVSTITTTIGEDNIAMARDVLSTHRIPIAAEDVGGSVHRKIAFNTGTGRVRLFSPNKAKKRIVLPVETPVFGRKKVLLVDDIARRLLSIKKYLEKRGHSVIASAIPRLAAQYGEKERVDVVITDARTDRVQQDAFCLCAHCKQNGIMKHIPVVIYTSSLNDGKNRYQAGYADYYLNRITSVDELNLKIEKILKAM